MDRYTAEVWRHAPAILKKLEGVIGRPKEDSKQELLAILGLSGSGNAATAEDSKPSVEDFEYAMHTAVMNRLETDDQQKINEVADMLDVTAAVVVELFERAAKPSMPSAETERCKAWWSMLLSIAEDTSRLIPIWALDRFIGDWEQSLVRLRTAYLQLARQRLHEFDAKQEADMKASEEAAAGGREGGDAKETKDQKDPKHAKDWRDKETKRIDERKKLITQLGISPNGQLYLTLTSLLKQLSSRLCNSLHAPLRARIVLLLERLLAMDHKAIANNQKLRSQDFVQLEDLDVENDTFFGTSNTAVAPSGDAPEASPTNGIQGDTVVADATAVGSTSADATAPLVAGAPGVNLDSSAVGDTSTAPTNAVSGSNGSSLGTDPAVDFELYQSFWGLQEALQYPEKLFEKPENWHSFHKALSKLLTLFLKHPVQDDARQPWAPPEAAPLRHAPRARALGVQLDDPGFRQQFLTQVMIAFQALEQDGSSRRGDFGGLISRQNDLARSEFFGLKRICEVALSQTRKGFPVLLKHVLDRESHWVSWKGHGCREFERESLDMLYARISPTDSIEENPGGLKKEKPQLQPYLSGLLKTLKDPQWRVSPASKASGEEGIETMRPHTMRGMCDTYLDRLIEEEKPENQIDEEYKAKRNKVFMWQCRRLFCNQYLRVYSQKDVTNKTDFMDFVRTVKGKPLLATSPTAGTQAVGGADPVRKGPEDGVQPASSGGNPVDGVVDDSQVAVEQQQQVADGSPSTSAPGVVAGGSVAEANGNGVVAMTVSDEADATAPSAPPVATAASSTSVTELASADTTTASPAADTAAEADTEVILVEAQRDTKREAPATSSDVEQQPQAKKAKRYEVAQ